MTRPDGNDASMKVKITGIQLKIFCCTGSGCCGFSCICTHIVQPMISGQRPMCRNCPNIGRCVGSNGNNPERLKMLDGSGAERSLIQPKNGACRMSMVTNSTL